MKEVLARGPNFVYARDFIQAEHGADTWRRVLEDLPSSSVEVWHGHLLVTGIYPFQAFKDLLRALETAVGAIREEETARMYEFIADRSLTTVHKFFFRFADPSFVIKRYPMLWERFFLTGKVNVATAEKGRAVLEFQLPNIFLDWLGPACAGYSKRAVELAGGRDFELQEISHQDLEGDSHQTDFELRWTE